MLVLCNTPKTPEKLLNTTYIYSGVRGTENLASNMQGSVPSNI